MHIDIVPNRGSSPAVLLRESYREGKKVRKRTLANLSSLGTDQIEAIRRVLRGERLVAVDDLFEVISSAHHGAVDAVLTAIRRLELDSVVAARSGRERQLVLAMVAARILEPQSKLATTRWWKTTTLPEELGVADATEDELYAAMDWLLERQGRIEQKLAARHLDEGSLVLYDLSSTYFEGTTCPLASLGYSRDGKEGKLQVIFGLVTNAEGCPVGVSVHPGNTGDPDTLLPQVRRIREVFGVDQLVLIGDRGLISHKQIAELQDDQSLHWITALRTVTIRKLRGDGALQMGLFDERNLVEFTHPAYPGERLIACRNAALARLRAAKRQSLLEATARELQRVQESIQSGRLRGRANIGMRVGRVINKYKVAKHFRVRIAERSFAFEVATDRVEAEAELDGIYVVRTSLPRQQMTADETVRSYKRLTNVERAFRSFKTIDLKVRPIHHRLEDRVRAHIFLCMLAYYVQWHLFEAWRPLLLADEDQRAKGSRDPVAPAERSPEALRKIAAHRLEDGSEAHSFRTLLTELSTIVRNHCRRRGAPETEPVITMTTLPNPTQRRALDLAAGIHV